MILRQTILGVLQGRDAETLIQTTLDAATGVALRERVIMTGFPTVAKDGNTTIVPVHGALQCEFANLTMSAISAGMAAWDRAT